MCTAFGRANLKQDSSKCNANFLVPTIYSRFFRRVCVPRERCHIFVCANVRNDNKTIGIVHRVIASRTLLRRSRVNVRTTSQLHEVLTTIKGSGNLQDSYAAEADAQGKQR